MTEAMTKEDLGLEPFEPEDLLTNDASIMHYLTYAFETGDEESIIDALGVVARAKGMTEVAEKAGLARTSLYRGLSKNGKPQFGTVLAVMKALGFKLDAKAA